MHDILATTKYERLTPEERERVKELRRMHIGEHAERSWPFESEVRVALAEHAPVSVAEDAAKMLREVMFWGTHVEEQRDFWVYRATKCHKGCDPDPEHSCCWHKMGLSKRNVYAARELLVANDLLEYTGGKGMPTGFHNRTHYRVTYANMLNLLDFLEKPLPADESTSGQHSWDERSNSVGTNGPTLTESTPREDIQRKYLHEGKEEEDSSSLSNGKGGVLYTDHETEQEPATDPRKPEPAATAHAPALGCDLADLVNDDLASRDKGQLTAADHHRFAREFDALHERGTTPDDLQAVALRVASMYPSCASWGAERLMDYALRDVEFDKET